MNDTRNPLSNIPDLNTRHMVMQVLAWMWCIIFSMSLGSITVFAYSAVAHTLLLAGIAITVGTFELAKRRPTFFLDTRYHTPSRSRGYMCKEDVDKILDKLEIISLRLDKVELQQKELLNKFATHIDFINETYEGLKNPLNAAKRLLGRK
jgi:hypothetical protein